MSGFTPLSPLPINSLSTERAPLNYGVLSSALTLLGWQGKHLLLTQEEEADRALANDLQTAYRQYLAHASPSSREDLNASLSAAINKLEKDQKAAKRLAKEANERLAQDSTAYSNGRTGAFVEEIAIKFKALFGSNDMAQMQHYEQLATKYTAQLEDLSHLRASLGLHDTEVTEVQGTISYASHSRRLLQINSTLPITQQTYCYPSGVCNLSALDEGISGFVLQGQAASDYSGVSVSSAGDVNGDGISDLLVGAYGATSSAGKSYVVFGSRNSSAWGTGSLSLSTLIDGQRGFVLQGQAASDYSGYSVSSAGDVNGDGISDLLVGAFEATSGAGKSYVVFGSRNSSAWGMGSLSLSTLIDGQRGFVLQGQAASDNSGYSVSSAGDVNGDGISDLLVGAYGATSGAGKSYVVFGSRNSSAWGTGSLSLSTLIDGQRGFVLQGQAASDNSGRCVSSAGDVNGDGISDLLVGAYGATSGAGKSYVVFGSRNSSAWGTGSLSLSTLIDGQRGFVLQGQAASDESGYSVSSAGDVNGDGISDLLVGAYGATSSAGKSYVVFGSRNSSAWGTGSLSLSTLIDGQRGFVLQGQAASDNSGRSVSSAGDINGDGISDLLVGAYGATSSAGKSYVVFGSRNSSAWGTGSLSLSTLIDGQRGFVLQGQAASDYSGYPVSSAGDINGDGISDLLVGAFGATSGAGKSYVVFGKAFSFTKNSLSIVINQTLTLGLGQINVASNVSGMQLNRTYFTVSNLTHGRFTTLAAPTVNISNFYLQNISDGQIQFVHDGTTSAPQYRLLASNPQISSLISIYSDAQITFYPYTQTLITNRLSVGQGMPVILNSSYLNATDSVNPPADLTFIITALMQGFFNQYAPNGTLIAANTTQFTQQAVMEGDIQFVPDGSRIPPSYQVSVNNPQTTLPPQAARINFDYAPELHLQPMIVNQGQATTLSFSTINATDVETATGNILIETANATGGYFLYNESGVITPVTSFNESSLLANSTAFVADENANTVSFILRAFDGALFSPWQMPIIRLNHRPRVVNNISIVNIAPNLFFDFTLSPTPIFIDPDNDSLTYQAQLTTGAPLPNTINFSPPQHFTGQMLGISSLSIEMIATDPRGLTAATNFVLQNSYIPPALTLEPMILDQGQATTLNPHAIGATDQQTFVGLLVFYATNATYGYFAYSSDLNSPITAFQQLSLTTDTVQFVQNGSDTTPGFALRVFDGALYSPWQVANVSLNHRPTQQHFMNDQTFIQGEDFSFSLPGELFKDPDGDPLSYKAGLQGGAPLPQGVQFTPPQQFSGNLPGIGSFTIEVGASDPRNVKASMSFVLSSKESKTAYYRSIYSSVMGVVGSGVALLGYLLWRKRVTNHRRGFEFANTLRKAANFEYHDFMRFDGDIYKFKLGQFLTHLHYLHEGFYASLNAAEKQSFAVCMSDILIARGLVSSSNCLSGLAGLLLFFSTGWSQQLDLKRFETEMVDIAQEAVTAWKAEADPLRRWPYHSPTKREKLKACWGARPSTAGAFSASRKLTHGITLARLTQQQVDIISDHKEPVTEQKLLYEINVKVKLMEQSLVEQSKVVKSVELALGTLIPTRLNEINERIEALEHHPLLDESRSLVHCS